MHIGIDIMGGDYFPQAPVEGALRARKDLGDTVRLVLIGDEGIIRKEVQKQGGNINDFDLLHTAAFIEMSESPVRAIKTKPHATINIGLRMVRENKLDGFVSAGNTGAMIASSMYSLGTIPGVFRPTIGILFPNITGSKSLLCDIGANLDSKAEQLAQFGILGSVYMEVVNKVERPRVALLNVGEEDVKGPKSVQEAYKVLSEAPMINFVGNLEGRHLFSGKADILVCDGYTGNILLKFAESMYDILQARKSGKDEMLERFNFENYGGVPILGIKGISIIGHGISTGKAIQKMIHEAVDAAESALTSKIEAAFSSLTSRDTHAS